MVEYLNKSLLQFTTESVSQKTENRLIFGEVMGKSFVSCFLTHGVDEHWLDQDEQTITSHCLLKTSNPNGEQG